MDVGKINGPGTFGRDSGRSQKVDREVVRTPRHLDSDVAHISDDGRAAHDSVEELADKARHADHGDREARVAAARSRLESGELSDPAVFEDIARRLLD